MRKAEALAREKRIIGDCGPDEMKARTTPKSYPESRHVPGPDSFQVFEVLTKSSAVLPKYELDAN